MNTAVLVYQPENLALVNSLMNGDDLTSSSAIEASTVLGAKTIYQMAISDESVFVAPIILEPVVLRSKALETTKKGTIISTKQFSLIYPNPSTGIVNIDFTSQEDGQLMIEIFDLQGKKIQSIVRESANAEALDLSNLENGMYLIRVQINNKLVAVERWTKQ